MHEYYYTNTVLIQSVIFELYLCKIINKHIISILTCRICDNGQAII